MPKKLVSGLRFFRCDECRHEWQEVCRDKYSSSGDACPECSEINFPISSEDYENETLQGTF